MDILFLRLMILGYNLMHKIIRIAINIWKSDKYLLQYK